MSEKAYAGSAGALTGKGNAAIAGIHRNLVNGRFRPAAVIRTNALGSRELQIQRMISPSAASRKQNSAAVQVSGWIRTCVYSGAHAVAVRTACAQRLEGHSVLHIPYDEYREKNENS